MKFSTLSTDITTLPVDHENKFLFKTYEALSELLKASKDDTTNYCPVELGLNQSNRGSSLDSAKLRKQYVSLCTTGLTSQVLNMSFRNKCKRGKSTVVEVIEASKTVIRFLLSPMTAFRNDYTLDVLESMELNWSATGQRGVIHVPGGLLFPMLTAALISYRSTEGITLITESYGGKRRGVHNHWNFHKTEPDQIQQVIENVKEAEKSKIPFIIREAFKILQTRWPNSVDDVLIYWGLGCDAIAKSLSEKEPSFLICQPVNIKSVDKKRNGSAADVFRTESEEVSSTDSQEVEDEDECVSDSEPEIMNHENVRVK